MPDSAPPAPEHDVALEQDLDHSLAEDDVDPVKETLDALHAKKEALQSEHPGLAAKIDLMTAANPHQHGRPSFRHDVAYLVQDVEKATAAPLATSQLTREEMTRLADSAPGLKNERMLDLLRMTSDLRDEPLVDEIRTTGTAIGRQRDQHTPDIRSQIEGLENRILLSQQPDASASPSPASRNDREPDMPRPPFNEPPADVQRTPFGSRRHLRRRAPTAVEPRWTGTVATAADSSGFQAERPRFGLSRLAPDRPRQRRSMGAAANTARTAPDTLRTIDARGTRRHRAQGSRAGRPCRTRRAQRVPQRRGSFHHQPHPRGRPQQSRRSRRGARGNAPGRPLRRPAPAVQQRHGRRSRLLRRLRHAPPTRSPPTEKPAPTSARSSAGAATPHN